MNERAVVVQILPGARLPADGIVEEGSSYTDESMLTGEVAPVPKRVGDAVIGGTVNLQSMLQVLPSFPIPLLPSAILLLSPLLVHAHGHKFVVGREEGGIGALASFWFNPWAIISM